jgi:hypothetical protein
MRFLTFLVISGLVLSVASLVTGEGQELDPPIGRLSGPESFRLGSPAAASSFTTNLILNGDFEITTSTGCDFNLMNAEFNSRMSHAFAFGTAEQLDIMNGADGCGYLGPPQSGTVKVGMSADIENGVAYDAFSLALSAPVQGGRSYTVSFYGWQWGRTFAPDIGPVLIGLSNDAASFGTLVFEVTPDTTGWTQHTHSFVAPLDAAHLTVAAREDTLDTWIQVDNFSLVDITSTPAAEASWGTVKSRYRSEVR